MNIRKESLKLHKKLKGKIKVVSKIQVRNSKDLTLVYTPGVAEVSKLIFQNKKNTKNYTFKNNSVAVISDGSSVLGLGNIGPEAALPVMEGKCLIFNQFAGIDAVPIVLDTQDEEEIIKVIKAIAPTFAGINLEDIAAPKCFSIEKRLKEELDIPVVHDDQWGAATVVLSALINALKVVEKKIGIVHIVISGAGAAGNSIAKILFTVGARKIIVVDSQGIIYKSRKGNSPSKERLAKFTNPENKKGDLESALNQADVFIGVSKGNLLKPRFVKLMNRKAIIFALANPVPEIMPQEAIREGAFIVATGRSDFSNQINNLLVFPGLFKGALKNNVKKIDIKMLIKAAYNIAGLIKKPTPKNIIPSPFNRHVVDAVVRAIR